MRRILGGIGKALAILVALVLVVVASGAYYIIQRPLPVINGSETVAGLEAPVEIIRDRWGVPHIFAQNEEDLMFAQGYVTAQDRLWQMEFSRRTGSGTLSEILGEVTLETDRFIRTVGFRRAAQAELERLDPETQRNLEAYARGVNTYIDSHPDKLPLEFTLLGFRPEPWQPLDSVTWGKVMAWDLGGNWESEILRAAAVREFGEDLTKALTPGYPADAPTIVPAGVSYAGISARALASYGPIKEALGAGLIGIGSNNWVVDGAKSTTGKPLLANDPHLGIAMPAIWYEIHLCGGGVDVTGASFPGVPGVIIGHNRSIAWGVTNVGPDVQDLYIEKINPDNPNQYLYQDKWEEMKVIREEIRVKGKQEPAILEVKVTRHGPILNSVVEGLEQPLALRWTASEPGTISRSVLAINRASNWKEFRDALRYWSVPSQNFVYADVQGNIGYQTPGDIPIRAKGNGLVPVPGWTGEYEWTGYIPFDELPSVYNPPTHFIATANNKVVGDDYRYLISYEWDPGYRAKRIVQMLTAKEKLGPEDFGQIHRDYKSLFAADVVPYLTALQPRDERTARALEYLKNWDFNLTADSVAGSIFETYYTKFLNNAYGSVMSPEFFRQYRGAPTHVLCTVNMLEDPTNAWRANLEKATGRRLEEIQLSSLEEAVKDLTQQLGNDMAAWRWGRLHRATFNHPFGEMKPLNLLFNAGPYETGGDGLTVNNAGYPVGKSFDQKTVPSLRLIANLADLNQSQFVHTTGQSGQLFARHRDDFIPLWLKGEYHPWLFERESIEKSSEARLTLWPR